MAKTINKTKAAKPLAFNVESEKADPKESPKAQAPAEVKEDNPQKDVNNAGQEFGEKTGKGKPFPTRQVGASVNVERVSLKIVDGKFDAASLRSETAERVREVMKNTVNDSEARSAFGLSSDAAPARVLVSEKTIGGVFDMCAKGQALILSKKTALPYNEIYPLVKWDKEEHEFLDPRGAELANKYIPESWLKYSDVTVFLAGLAQLIQAKAKAVEDYAQKRVEAIGAAGATSQPQSTAGNSSPEKQTSIIIADIPPEQKARSLE